MVLASVLAYCEFTRDCLQCVHVFLSSFPSKINLNLVTHRIPMQNPQPANPHRGIANQQANNRSISPKDAQEPVVLPHTQLCSWFVHSCIFRLESILLNVSSSTLLSSLMTLSWFLTAHVLEHTSVHSCRHSSPQHLEFSVSCIL